MLQELEGSALLDLIVDRLVRRVRWRNILVSDLVGLGSRRCIYAADGGQGREEHCGHNCGRWGKRSAQQAAPYRVRSGRPIGLPMVGPWRHVGKPIRAWRLRLLFLISVRCAERRTIDCPVSDTDKAGAAYDVAERYRQQIVEYRGHCDG